MLTADQLVDPFHKLCPTVNIPHATAVACSQVTSHRVNAAPWLLLGTLACLLLAIPCVLLPKGVSENMMVRRELLNNGTRQGTVSYGINDCYILSSMILSFPQLNLGVEILHLIYMQLTSGGHAIFPLNPNLTHMKHLMNSFIVMVFLPV